jgi:exocyst complex component 3
MAAPTISAAQAIGEYLQSPDDLMKIPAFRKKLEKEKASIDIRVNGGVKEQLGVTSESLRKLFSTRDNVQAIRDEMVIVDRMCSDPQNVVSTFDQISRVRPFYFAPPLVILINHFVGIDRPQKFSTNRGYGQ